MAHFDFQFLGSGNSRSKPPVNYNTNILVHAPGGKWLIDCGVTGMLALRNAGINTIDIKAAFITHLHGDHVYGLEELLFEAYFKLHRKVGLWLPEAFLAPGAVNGENIWENFLQASMTSSVLLPDGSYSQLGLSDYADVVSLSSALSYDFFGVPVRIFPVSHVWHRSAFGICLDERVVFTADTVFSRKAIEEHLERGAEVIFHDVSFLPPKKGGVHASFDELKTLPRDIIEKIVLMHYADEVTEDEKKCALDAGFRLAHCGEVFRF